jgi:hypothetical protein
MSQIQPQRLSCFYQIIVSALDKDKAGEYNRFPDIFREKNLRGKGPEGKRG